MALGGGIVVRKLHNMGSTLRVILISLLFSTELIKAATHWIVTQDGRITAQMDSVFQLNKPHDLMALLAQEDRLAEADYLREELFQKKLEFENKDEKDSGSLIEEKLYTTDADCLKVGRKVTTMAIFESTFSSFGSYGINVRKEMPESKPGHREPDCSSSLDFSMQTFEHLVGMVQRASLAMEPEPLLKSAIPKDMNMQEFANWISVNIERNNTSWVAFNLATLYYRILGNSFKALQCCRLALYHSPREFKTIALVSMGNVLMHSHQQEDGIIVLHAAVDHTPEDPIAHYTLANSYALIGDLNRSVLCYENVLKLQPDLDVALKKMHGIQCLYKLQKALETQHSVLQNTLTELKDQQKKFEEWNQLHEKIINAQATVGKRLRSQLEYQESRFRSTRITPVPDCEQYEEDGFMFFQCNIKTDMSTLETWGSAMVDLRNRLAEFQTQTDKIVDLLSLRNVAANQSSQVNHFNESVGEDLLLQHPPPGGTRLVVEEQATILPLTDNELHRCPSLSLPKVDQVPTVILAPESLGFNIKELLNDKIDLNVDEDHPLPWYPPVCDKNPAKLSPYDEIGAVKARNEMTKRVRDMVVQKHLLSYVKTNVDDLVHGDADEDIQTTTALAQVGQRILTALRNKVGPPWLLNTLAGLYWRGHGRSSNSIECFRQALSTVPHHHAFVPLTNLAALLLKLGHTKDALSVATLAHDVSSDQADTNFLLGLLHLLNGNYSLSVAHLQRTLLKQPDFPKADQHRLIAACLSAAGQDSGDKDRKDDQLQCQGQVNDAAYRTVLRCSKTPDDGQQQKIIHVEEEEEVNCDTQVQAHTTVPGSLEVAVIADTEDAFENEFQINEGKFINFELLQADYLPEGLLRMGKLSPPMPMTLQQCQGQKIRPRSKFTSTWLSVAAKNVDFKSLVGKSLSTDERSEPVCDAAFPVTMATMDHLTGVRHRDMIDYKAESALEEALVTLVYDTKDRVQLEQVAGCLHDSLRNNATSWVLTTAASLYWRVKGNAKNAIDCLRIALHQVPYAYKDIPLISLANILHRAGLDNDALVASYMALEISPTFVVIHFTLANIHAARGDVVRALSFYQSTLSLQPSFEPARQQLIELQCKQLLLDEHVVI